MGCQLFNKKKKIVFIVFIVLACGIIYTNNSVCFTMEYKGNSFLSLETILEDLEEKT